VVHTFNPSIPEAENHDLVDSLSYIARHCPNPSPPKKNILNGFSTKYIVVIPISHRNN
jgi:hypothetical protein